MNENQNTEGKILRLSIFAQIFFSLLGIAFGLLLSSDVIMFDGVYSLFGLTTSFATLQVSRFIQKKDHHNFPFGKEHIVPTVVVIQYLLVSAFLLSTLYSAVLTLLAGGHPLQLGPIFIYLIVVAAVLFIVVRRLKGMATTSPTSLVQAELVQWELSLRQTLFTLGSYLLAFAVMLLAYDSVLPYIDSSVLILFILFSFFTVLRELKAAFKELIGMRTISDKLQKEIEGRVQYIVKTYAIKDYFLRVNKMGDEIAIEIDFLVDKEYRFDSVYQQDGIRNELEKSLSHIPFDIWLSIAFTTQYKWVDL